MFLSRRTALPGLFSGLALGVICLLPAPAWAQVGNPFNNPVNNPFNNPFNNPLNNQFNPFGGIGVGVGSGMSPTPQTRNTYQVNNAINYFHYQQTTGMGPSIGWVSILTQFPPNGSQTGFGGGLNSGFTGNINLGANGSGMQQPNNGGSDPPSGVFLAVNYGTLVGLPFQPQQQQQGFGGFGGGLGFGGNQFGIGNQFGGGKGIGGFGNGGSGL